MKMYIWGILLTGLPPLIWGGYLHYDDLMKHINGTGYRRTIMGYPRAIVIFGFILCFGEVRVKHKQGPNRNRAILDILRSYFEKIQKQHKNRFFKLLKFDFDSK